MKKLLLLSLLLFSITINAQNPANIDLIVGSGYIDFHRVSAAAIQTNGKIVIGGTFLDAPSGQHWRGHMARLNTDGTIDPGFTVSPLLSSGFISSIAIQNDGKILVGGNFTTMNGENVGHLIRLNSDGSKDSTFINEIYGMVRSITIQPNGKILIAGSFSSYINNHQQRYLLRLNSDGSKDETFDFGFEGFAALYTQVNVVSIQADGKILAGGNFTNFNGSPQGMIIRFNADGTKDNSFDIGTGCVPNSKIECIIQQPDGKLLVSSARNWNGVIKAGVIRLNSDGSLDSSFDFTGGSYNDVSRIALKPNGKVMVTGRFTINQEQIRVLCLNSDGTLDPNFELMKSNANVHCLEVQSDGKTYIGGNLNEFNGVMKNSFLRININGTVDSTFNLNTGLNDVVNKIVIQDNSKTLIGGNFTHFQGNPQNRLVSLNYDGSQNTSFSIGSGFNKPVHDIIIQSDGKILVSGEFTEYNGVAAHKVIRLNADGSKDNSFNIGSGFNEFVQSIVLQSNGKIILGGTFTMFNGQPQKYCIRLNTDGSKDHTFINEDTFDDRVTRLAIRSDGKIMAAGNFFNFNGIENRYLILLNSDGSKDSNFNVGSSFGTTVPPNYIFDVINDIVFQKDDKLLIVGMSDVYQGQPLGLPIRINMDGTIDSTFSQSVIFGQGQLKTLALQENGKILVGGSFNSINGGYQGRIIRLNKNGGQDTLFKVNEGHHPEFGGFSEGRVNDITVAPNGRIWAGGSFFHYRGESSFSAVRLVGDEIDLSVKKDQLKKKEIVLYPNPVSEVLYLNKTAKKFEITDMTGKTMSKSKNISDIDVSTYPKGFYFITTESENGLVEYHKIVKH